MARISFLLTEIKNLTTQTQILSAQKNPLEVTEYGPRQLVFQSPTQCQPGHLVSFEGKFNYANETVGFSATAKVAHTEKLDGQFRVELELQQFDQSTWKVFIKRAEQSQKKADKVFSSIRGNEG